MLNPIYLMIRLWQPKHHWLQRTKAKFWTPYRKQFFREFGIWPEEHAKWSQSLPRAVAQRTLSVPYNSPIVPR